MLINIHRPSRSVTTRAATARIALGGVVNVVGPFASAFKAGVVGRIAARVATMASGEDRLQFPLLLAVEVRTLAWEVAGAVLLVTAAAASTATSMVASLTQNAVLGLE